MDNNSNLDKKIEAALKANLNSISASDELIARTLEKLNQANSGATVTPMPKKKRKVVPVAIISAIAASLIAIVGASFILWSTNNQKGSVKKTINSVDSSQNEVMMADEDMTKQETMAVVEYIIDETENSMDIVSEDSMPVNSFCNLSNVSLISSKSYMNIQNRAFFANSTSAISCVYFSPYYTNTYRNGFTTEINNSIEFKDRNDQKANQMKMVTKPIK